jgi:hypothetical protein
MKNVICFMVAVFFCISISQAQSYSRVKVTLKKGFVFKGSKALLDKESITFRYQGNQKTFPLSDVLIVEARDGKAGKWALGCGGGCLAVCAIAGAVSGKDGIEEAGATVGQYVAGTFIWTGIFAGVGAIIGSLSDKYRNVYTSSSTSWLNRFKFDLTSNQPTKYYPAKYSLTLAYKLK